MDIRPAVSYITCAISSKEQTGDIITFTQFEEGNLLSESLHGTEINEESDDENQAQNFLT